MAGRCEKKIARRPARRRAAAGKDIRLFSPLHAAFSEEQAVSEAARCLAVGPCDGCDLCSLLCPDLCITRDEGKGVVIDLEYCKGCGICAAVCPKKAITMVPGG